MSPVTFNEPSYEFRSNTPKSKGITGWLVARGFAKDDKGANVLMLSIAGIGFAIMVGVWITMPSKHTQTPQERARIEASTRMPIK